MVAVGQVFPVGGWVPRERMVGREEAIADVVSRLDEQIGVTLVGPRRIGKTSVGPAVCDELAATHVVVRVEVPEGPTPSSSAIGSSPRARRARSATRGDAR